MSQPLPTPTRKKPDAPTRFKVQKVPNNPALLLAIKIMGRRAKAAGVRYGGQEALARALGITQGLVSQWITGRTVINSYRAMQIVVLVDHPDITYAALRPDIRAFLDAVGATPKDDKPDPTWYKPYINDEETPALSDEREAFPPGSIAGGDVTTPKNTPPPALPPGIDRQQLSDELQKIVDELI